MNDGGETRFQPNNECPGEQYFSVCDQSDGSLYWFHKRLIGQRLPGIGIVYGEGDDFSLLEAFKKGRIDREGNLLKSGEVVEKGPDRRKDTVPVDEDRRKKGVSESVGLSVVSEDTPVTEFEPKPIGPYFDLGHVPTLGDVRIFVPWEEGEVTEAERAEFEQHNSKAQEYWDTKRFHFEKQEKDGKKVWCVIIDKPEAVRPLSTEERPDFRAIAIREEVGREQFREVKEWVDECFSNLGWKEDRKEYNYYVTRVDFFDKTLGQKVLLFEVKLIDRKYYGFDEPIEIFQGPQGSFDPNTQKPRDGYQLFRTVLRKWKEDHPDIFEGTSVEEELEKSGFLGRYEFKVEKNNGRLIVSLVLFNKEESSTEIIKSFRGSSVGMVINDLRTEIEKIKKRKPHLFSEQR